MKLSELIKKTEFSVPGTSLKVTFKEDLSWYEYIESTKINDEIELGVFTLTCMIESWNLTDEETVMLPITVETVKKLPRATVVALTEKATELIKSKTEKKKS